MIYIAPGFLVSATVGIFKPASRRVCHGKGSAQALSLPRVRQKQRLGYGTGQGCLNLLCPGPRGFTVPKLIRPAIPYRARLFDPILIER